MENYAVLVNHQCFVRFLRTTGFVEFEAISRSGISSLLVIGTLLWSSGESENTKRWKMFCLEDKKMLNVLGRTE